MLRYLGGFKVRELFSLIAMIGLVCAGAVRAQQPVVDKLVLDDTIQSVSAGLLERAIAHANSQGAAALLIEINTPGGLVDSMRTMAGAILSSRVPVIVYVAPAGARAGSAGFFLLEAADIAAMAPGTNAGAAHVVFEGGKPDEVLSQKVENDAEAFLRSYVAKRNRNTEAAIAAVASSHSYTADEALNQHLIDVIAPNDAQLLDMIDGRQITLIDGSKLTLHTKNAQIEVVQPTMRENLLGWLVNPNIALLFLVGGALLIYLEFNTPGTIVPGALGTSDGAAGHLRSRPAAHSVYGSFVVDSGLCADVPGSEVWRPRRARIGGDRLFDLRDVDAGCRSDSGTPRKSMGCGWREPRVRNHHGLSRPTGHACTANESQTRGRRAGGQRSFCNGAARTRRPRAGGRRDMASRGQRTGSSRRQAPRSGARAIPAPCCPG